MKRKLFIFLTIMLVSALNASAETNGKTKVIGLKPVTYLADGTIVNTSFSEGTETIQVEVETTTPEEVNETWIEIVIVKDGLEVTYGSFNPMNNQLSFNLTAFGNGTYQVWTVAETDAQLIAILIVE